MNLAEYTPYWNAVKPAMVARMSALVGRVRANIPSHMTVDDPYADEGSEEFKVCSNIRVGDTAILNLDFILGDGDEDGESGLCVALTLTGYNALTMGGYTPGAYTSQCFVDDVDVLVERVKGLDVGEMQAYITFEALKNPALISEAAKDGITV